MVDPPIDERGRLLSQLAATLTSLPEDQPQTWRLCEAVRRILGADGAVITVEYLSPTRATVCATDDVAAALEDIQEVVGEGPGFDAARSQEVVTVDLRTASDRWPMLAQSLEQHMRDLRLHAVPLDGETGLAGVVTLYTAAGAKLATPVAHTVFLANATGAALLTDSREHTPGDGLSGGWSSRAVVHQATGMVMAQLAIPPEDAVALLRGHAYALETDIAEVARQVVDREINFLNFEVEGD